MSGKISINDVSAPSVEIDERDDSIQFSTSSTQAAVLDNSGIVEFAKFGYAVISDGLVADRPIYLYGVINGQAQVYGDFVYRTFISSSVQGLASVDAIATKSQILSGLISAIGSSNGEVTKLYLIAAWISANASVSSTLTLAKLINGSANAYATTASDLTVTIPSGPFSSAFSSAFD